MTVYTPTGHADLMYPLYNSLGLPATPPVYLAERQLWDGAAPIYASIADGKLRWSPDPGVALRFARAVDVDAFVSTICTTVRAAGTIRATEHIFS